MRWRGKRLMIFMQNIELLFPFWNPLPMLSWKIFLNCVPTVPQKYEIWGLFAWEAVSTKPEESAGGLQACRRAAVWPFFQHLVSLPYLGSWRMAKPREGSWVRCFQDCPGRGFLVIHSPCSAGVTTSTDTCSALQSWAFQRVCCLLWDFGLLYSSCESLNVHLPSWASPFMIFGEVHVQLWIWMKSPGLVRGEHKGEPSP